MGPSFVVTSSKQINSTQAIASSEQSELESSQIFLSVVTKQPIPKEVSGSIKFHCGVVRVLNDIKRRRIWLTQNTAGPFLASRPYAFEYEENGVRGRHNSVVPSSHKCSVMGHKRPYLKQPWKCGDFEVFTIIFFRTGRQENYKISFSKKYFGGLVAL